MKLDLVDDEWYPYWFVDTLDPKRTRGCSVEVPDEIAMRWLAADAAAEAHQKEVAAFMDKLIKETQ